MKISKQLGGRLLIDREPKMQQCFLGFVFWDQGGMFVPPEFFECATLARHKDSTSSRIIRKYWVRFDVISVAVWGRGLDKVS